MENLPQTIDKEHLENIEIVQQTARQIIKDFAAYGLEIHFSGSATQAYHELCPQMASQLFKLMECENERLFALMYHIDLHPDSVWQCLTSPDKPFEKLADLVIRREMLKVLTVRYFKSQHSKPAHGS